MPKKINSYRDYLGDEEDDDQGGSTSASSQDGFHLDFLTAQKREDLLSPEELKRLLKVHPDEHYELVKKQRDERKARRDLKEGKRSTESLQSNYTGTQGGYGMDDHYKSHPITQKAYFSGIDKQVTAIADQYQANTNKLRQDNVTNDLKHKHVLKNDLQNRNELKHRKDLTFNPRPKPF